MEDSQEIIETKRQEVLNFEKSQEKLSKEIALEICNSTYYNTHLQQMNVRPLVFGSNLNKNVKLSPPLKLLFEDRTDLLFSKALRSIRLYDINYLICYNILEQKRSCRAFMSCLFPKKASNFQVTSSWVSQVKFTSNLNHIIKISPRVLNLAIFSGFIINERQLKRLLSSFKHVHRLFLKYCIIYLPNAPNFSASLTNWKITRLYLEECDMSTGRDEDKDPKGFLNLIEVLTTCSDVKVCLRKVITGSSVKDLSKAREIFSKNGFGKVQIIEYE
ncbi:unnamed protein product [Moneuplotes crassus]|uniref:Uncharacterized protein n=1 Tax=Euplotes crassus TaxID=5936 RepID=A0AAD1X1Q8_EUPCR|nr:unnamed protein product [Moneuplotes crassus]